MNNIKGYTYVLTNPSFPEYVKIGYATFLAAELFGRGPVQCPAYFRYKGELLTGRRTRLGVYF